VRIPYSRPAQVGTELGYLREALEANELSSGGRFGRRCEEWLKARTGARAAHLTHSATAALEMAALLAELGPGDEVVMPAFAYVSCANAVALRGAKPVFVEVRRESLNIDPQAVADALTPRTRAILVLHYAGVPCDMAPILELAERRGLLVIEDAAHALLSTWRGRMAGTLGHLGILSFHATKNVACGEGGALLVNDARFAERAERLLCKGTDRADFLRGERPRYVWVDLGSSFALGELAAAFLLAQLEAADEITRERRAQWQRYHEAFRRLDEKSIGRPTVPAGVEHNGHIYYLVLGTPEERERFIAAMRARGITTPFHYVPLDDTPAGRRLGRAAGSLAETRHAAARLVRLPLWHGMGEAQDAVIAAVLEELG